MKNTKYVKYVSGLTGLATVAMLAVALPAFAQTATGTATIGATWTGHLGGQGGGMHGMMKPGVFGTVTAVNGDIITITSTPHRMRPMGSQSSSTGSTTTTTTPTTTTYTVDATNATVTKANVASSVSAIAVGDTIMAQGTLTGTNLVATTIRDGIVMRTPGTQGTSGATGQGQMTSPITGNGQPVVAGAVTAVSGDTIQITNKSNVSYTVDATNAKVVEGQNVVTISNVAVGDNVIVQGTVSGNAVTASSVIDQKANTTTSTNGTTVKAHAGFFGAIGSFFSHIFGF